MPNLPLASLVAAALLLIYGLVIKPRSSPLRHLPAPSQGPAHKRLLVEPNADQLAQWCHEIPNEGFIKYHGILNVQKGLTLEVMQELDARVELEKQTPKEAAAAYLEAAGYVE